MGDDLEAQLEAARGELHEAVRLQAATSEVLRLISDNPGDLRAVMRGITVQAATLCDAHSGSVQRIVGDELEFIALSTEFGEQLLTGTRVPRTFAAADGPTFIDDIHAEIPGPVRSPARSLLGVPLSAGGVPFGALTVTRLEVRPFEERHARILQAFADQAAIAITNAGLFNDLAESLELQTATSEVLRLISDHPGDLQSVFDRIVELASRLCGAQTATIHRVFADERQLEMIAASSGVARENLGRRDPFRSSSSFRETVFVDDLARVPGFVTPAGQEPRSCAVIGLHVDDELYGLLLIARAEVRPFGEPDGAVLRAFAEQATIAISNAKLFNGLDAALMRQTANAEILRVISTSPGDLGQTLPEIYRAAQRLTNATHLAITYGDDDQLTIWDAQRGFRTVDGAERQAVTNRIADEARATGRPMQLVGRVADWREHNPVIAGLAADDGIVDGAVLLVPMQGNLGKRGFIIARRNAPIPFSADEISLLEEFTAQAVIALDNSELLATLETRNNDLAESLELQTATSEVLRLIGDHPGDLDAVFRGIVEQAAAMCDANNSAVMLRDGDDLVLAATSAAGIPYLIGQRFRISSAFDTGAPALVDDLDALMNRTSPTAIRSLLSVPLVADGVHLGQLNVSRNEVRPFDSRHASIMQAFADQAVLAIQNSDLFRELEQRNHEIKAALEQQTAVGAVLQTISRSAFDLGAVLNELSEQAHRLVGGSQTGIVLVEPREGYLYPPEFRDVDGYGDEQFNGFADPAVMDFHIQRKRPFFATIATAEAAQETGVAALQRNFEVFGPFSNAIIPLLHDDHVVGLLAVIRAGVDRFNESEKRLLRTFADQAVIAVQNARLFRELEERNREVSEALEQQTAIAEVLEIISSSPTDLEPVLSQVLGIAARLCVADSGVVWQARDGRLRVAAHHGYTSPEVDFLDSVVYPVAPGARTGTTADGGVHRFDFDISLPLEADEALTEPDRLMRYGNGRQAYLIAPLIRPGSFEGGFSLMRKERRPFTERDEAIVQTFADQALIAIENSRLFNALEQSNRDVSAALEQQTAVASVLQTISRSAFDLEAVLNELVEQAHRLVPSIHVAIRGLNGREYGAIYVYPPSHMDHYLSPETAVLGPFEESVLERNRLIATTVRTADRTVSALADSGVERWGPHSVACVPMRSSGGVVGLMSVVRQGEERFTDVEKQVLQTFADQAVIAIENSRLFRELEHSNQEVSAALEQQTAVAAVLQTISRSAFDLDIVLHELAEQAFRLVNGYTTVLNVYREGSLVPAASVGASDSALSFEGLPFVTEMIAQGRPRYVTARRGSIHGDYDRFIDRMARLGEEAMSLAFVPLMSGDDCLGAVTVTRLGDVRFTDSEKQLLQTFADQAVIAIENARLFSELQAKTEELEIASQHKSEFLANMSHELRTPLNAIIGYAELIAEECADLGNEEFLPDLAKIQSAGKHLLTLISGILDLAKVEAGRMDLFIEPIDIAAMVTEVDQIVRPLVEKNRNTFALDCPAHAGTFDADLVKVKQVLFNLLSNSAKFTDGGTITLSVTRLVDTVEFAITDTGIGMSEEQMGRLFEAFSQADVSTTRKYGGTGLGLALSRSFCQMMGGDIAVTSELGVGSTFTVTLPIAQQGPA